MNRRGQVVSDEELMDIDNFAAEIFGWNRHEIVNETVNKPLQEWDFIKLPDFTGTVTRKSSAVTYAKPTNLTMNNFSQGVLDGYGTQYEQPNNFGGYSVGIEQPTVNSNFNTGATFPFHRKVDTVTGHQTGYVHRYNPVTSTVPNQDQYTDYYHSNMPTVDPNKVQRNKYNPYSALFNKGNS